MIKMANGNMDKQNEKRHRRYPKTLLALGYMQSLSMPRFAKEGDGKMKIIFYDKISGITLTKNNIKYRLRKGLSSTIYVAMSFNDYIKLINMVDNNKVMGK
jgi:hypothetical protein